LDQIEARAAEFNHETAFRKLLQNWRDGVPRVVERALLALEEAALRGMDACDEHRSPTPFIPWPKLATALGPDSCS